jgi:hypothetical protein
MSPTSDRMRKRDEQIVVRLAKPLRRELEQLADQEGRTVSDTARRLLIEQLWTQASAAEVALAAARDTLRVTGDTGTV